MNEHWWLCSIQRKTTLQLNLLVSAALHHYGLLVCPAHPRAMLYALKIVTDVSLFAHSILHTYHVFVGGAMMTIRCVASNLMIVCPCDDGDYAEFARITALSARISASCCALSCMSARINGCSNSNCVLILL